MRTVFLLDVDGPLNADKAGWSAAPVSGYAYDRGSARNWKMRWEPKLMSRLRRIEAQYPQTIYWATSWCGSTDNLERLFKLPALLSAASSRMSGADKLMAANAVMEAGDRLIWADDEYTPDSGELYDEWTATGRALLLRPKATGKRQGLRPEDLDLIDQFMLGS
jgi:hypothetical protein